MRNKDEYVRTRRAAVAGAAGIARRLYAIGAAMVMLASALPCFTCAAHAADWPTRPVAIVLPYAAGGSTDTMARLAAKFFSEKFGQPFLVDNRSGASGVIGTTFVARAEPDGYTLLFASPAQMITVPLLQKVNYDPGKSFVPISIFGGSPFILGIKASIPAETLQAFIAYAKANPGKLNYATAGQGSTSHMTSALFLSRAGVNMVHVPYKGGAPAMAALLAGEIEMYFGSASDLMQHTTNDRIRVLATSGAQRMPQLPDTPTAGEVFPGFKITSWNGFLAPAGTPPEIIDRIAQATQEAANDASIAERLNALGIVPTGTTPAEFADVIRSDKAFYVEAVKAAAIKPDD